MKTIRHAIQSKFTRQALALACAFAPLLLAPAPAVACGDYGTLFDPALVRVAELAVSPDADRAEAAIKTLRARGQDGLNALFTVHEKLIGTHRLSSLPGKKPSPERARIRHAVDSVGAQRDCRMSRLYWFTDMDKASAEAKRLSRPILSLRLLGNLNEDLSCANSRFFRTALYANAEVADYLRRNFVLHWKSVRPVPRITVDFGDGRKLERTVTGNSIHYVLDANGRPIDAMPGLYGPKAFLAGLERARVAAGNYKRSKGAKVAEAFLKLYHAGRVRDVEAKWLADLKKVGGRVRAVQPVVNRAAKGAPARRPTAVQGAKVAVTKMGGEINVINSMLGTRGINRASIEKSTSDAEWARIAALHAEGSRLDKGSRRLMAAKHPDALTAGRLTAFKRIAEDPLLRSIRLFERSMAEDTVRNEYLFHSEIHRWFAQGNSATRQVAALNKRVYADLFLTPDSDPWLGLKSRDVYTAIDGDGVRVKR